MHPILEVLNLFVDFNYFEETNFDNYFVVAWDPKG